MRLLTLSTPPGHCGIGDYNAEISDSLKAQGHQVDLIELLRCGDRTPPLDEFARRIDDYDGAIIQHEFSFFSEHFDRVGMFGRLAQVLRALRRSRRPAIVLLHTDMFEIARRPVLRPWSLAARERTARRRMINEINRTPGLRALVHSETSLHSWIKIGVLPQKITSIAFAMRPASSYVEPRPLSDTDTVELAIFGFLSEHKGYEVALNALRILPENYVLTIAGEANRDDPNIRILDAIYGFLHTGEWVTAEDYDVVRPVPRRYTERERQSMLKRVRVTGYVEPGRIPEVMARADILLLPYRAGPSGSAALGAALSFARPTIASGVDAFRNVARQTDCFRVVAIDAPYQLAETIRAVAMDLDERRRMFNASRAFAEAHSFEALARNCVQILSQLGGTMSSSVVTPRHNPSGVRTYPQHVQTLFRR